MSRATPTMREFAERLIAYEAKGKKPLDARSLAGFDICEKLRPQLATLMGKGGFNALLSRALALSSAEVPRLSAVQLQEDGSLAGTAEPDAPAERQELANGSVLVLAHLLTLLEAFIGENLTLRILDNVWPKLTLSALFFEKENPK